VVVVAAVAQDRSLESLSIPFL